MAAYPSPPLSLDDYDHDECDFDALSDEALDAYLSAQGPMSSWPTPPPPRPSPRGKDIGVVVTVDDAPVVDQEGDTEAWHDGSHYTQLAEVFAQEAVPATPFTPIHVDQLYHILLRAQLPPEILAFTFNILIALHRSPATISPHIFTPQPPPDLLLTSAMALAAAYTHDQPPSFTYWSHEICNHAHDARRIDQTALHILSALGWRMHDLCSTEAICRALERLTASAPALLLEVTGSEMRGSPMSEDYDGDYSHDDIEAVLSPPSLKIIVYTPPTGSKSSSTCWRNGQVTPEGTPIKQTLECNGGDLSVPPI